MKTIYLSLLFGGIVSSQLFGQTFNCGDSLLDTRDGQKYATVLIGSDCWFQQNLNYGTLVNSDSSGTIHSDQSNNGIPEKYAQNNNAANLSIYGGLYEWAELMNYSTIGEGQGLCPDGWHVSTDAEWNNVFSVAGVTMITATEGNGGNKLKKVGEGFGGGIGTDDVGFSAKHGGDRDGFGIFYGLGNRAIIWTSTLQSPGQAYNYHLWGGNDTIQKFTTGATTTAFACRCVQNAGTSGMNEGTIELKTAIYPNPAGGIVMIKIDLNLIGAEYSIVDLLGKKMMQGILMNENTQLDLSSLKNGVYTIQIGTQKTERLMIIGK